MRVAATSPRTIAFIKDFEAATAMLSAGERRTTTQMGISTENCGTLETRIRQFSDDDHQLIINGSPTGAALLDGIYGGSPQTNGYPIDFPVTLTPRSTTPLPNIPAGFAVWLYHASIPTTLELVHSRNPPGEWYYEQRVGENSVVYWFKVSLEDGETITIRQP
jgi:hypothetical protein